jgi:branched-chain amino acid transport system permease protein
VKQALRVVRERHDVAALVVLVLATFFFPKHVPPGIYGLGIVNGAALALQAIGLVLVYRSNRIINFAQVQFGAVAATFFVVMVRYFPLGRGVRAICPPCLDHASGAVLRANYFLSLTLALLISIALGYLTYALVVKRFANAPRLVLTVATIFIVQVLGGLESAIPLRLTTADQRKLGLQLGAAGGPFHLTIEWAPARFNSPDILTVLISGLAVVGLLVYFRRSRTGIAIRASAENPNRASTLGVNVDSVTSRVWVLAATLSGVAALLSSMTLGASGGGTTASLGVPLLLKMLAVAVIARMVSLPIAAAGAVAFGILEQAVQWSFGSTTILDGSLVLLIGAILLLQRYRASRADVEQASAWKADREIRPVPSELRGLVVVQNWKRWIIAIGIIAALGFPWAMSSGQTNLAGVWMIYAMVGLSLLVLTGWAGQISLGQFAFAAVGGWIAAASRLPFPLAIVLATIGGALIAVIIGIPAIKLRGLHLAIMTLAFAVSTTAVLLDARYLGRLLPDSLGRPAFLGMRFDDERVFYYFTLLMLVGVNVVVMGIRRSRTARALIAARDNERAAQSFGIDIVRARLAAFAISGGIAAFAGALFAFHQHGVKAVEYPAETSVTMFLIAIIGGFGGIAGPQIGALYYGVLGLISKSAIVTYLGTGGVGLLVLMALPGGLVGGAQRVRDSVLKRIAKRNRIVVPSLLADVRIDPHSRERAPILPKVRSGGGSDFVPERYRLADQWAMNLPEDTFLHANLQTVHRGPTKDSTFGSASESNDD